MVDAKQKRSIVALVVGLTGVSFLMPQFTTFLGGNLIAGLSIGMIVGLVDLWAAWTVYQKGTFA